MGGRKSLVGLVLVMMAAAPLGVTGDEAPQAGVYVRAIIPDAGGSVPMDAPHDQLDELAAVGLGPGSQIRVSRPDGGFICSTSFLFEGTSIEPNPAADEDPEADAFVTATKLYIGTAGHCILPETGATSTHGPDADYDPSLTQGRICVAGCFFGGQAGAVVGTYVPLGPAVYARQSLGGDAIGNDFGIFEVPEHLAPQVRYGMPVWGDMVGATDGLMRGQPVCHFGAGVGTGETFATKARLGVGLSYTPDNERFNIASRGQFEAALAINGGDSGSGAMICGADLRASEPRDGEVDATQKALGTITHIYWQVTGSGTLVEAGAAGTTVERGINMAQEAGIELVLLV